MTKEKIYSTNLVLAAGFIIISLVFKKLDFLLYVALGVMVLTTMSDFLGLWIAKAWMGFGKILGNINGKIILSLFFFILLVPIAFLKKIIVKKETENSNSNWQMLEKEEAVQFDKLW
jgi:hypothetical protein